MGNAEHRQDQIFTQANDVFVQEKDAEAGVCQIGEYIPAYIVIAVENLDKQK